MHGLFSQGVNFANVISVTSEVKFYSGSSIQLSQTIILQFKEIHEKKLISY